MLTSRRTIYRNGNKEGNAHFLSNSSKINNKIPDLEETTKKLLQLELDYNYQITQINGQRKFGPPLNWTGPAPDPKCEVFVGRIPRTIFEPDLYPIFSLIGRIYEIRLMMDFSGMNRGFCFIMYTKPEDAYHAVKELNYYEICPGHRIGVVNSINHCRLLIKQLPLNIKAEEVVQRIYDTTDEVKEVLVYRNYNEPECYAIINYQTHRGAAISRKRLLPLTSSLFSNSKVIVDWANPTFRPTDVFEERGTCDEDGRITLKKVYVPSTERYSKSTEKLSKIGDQLTFNANGNYYNHNNNSINYSKRFVNESLPSFSLANKIMNYAKDFVKPSKSSFQERKKIIQPNTRSSTIVFSNNYLTSNLNPHTLSFFQQNNRIFTSNNIEGSSLDQNDLTLNHVTPFNDRKTLLQPKEEFIQSYPYSQVISMLQSYSNLNDNSNQNDSTNLNQHDQKSNPCCFICLPNVSNYNCLKQEESQENLNINNLQDVQQNQLIIDTYNPQNTIYKDVTKYNNVTNNVPSSSSSSYSIGSNYYFEQEYNDNRINLVNQSKCCYVQKQLACDFCDCDQNDNVFNILKYSKGGRPILKRKL